MTNEQESFYSKRGLENAYFKHGWPTDQWEYLKYKKVPLSTKIPFEDWNEITQGRVPDLTLAHYLASRHVVLSLPIPQRVKDAVVIAAPQWVREDLNQWNKDTGHFKYKYGFGDIRIVAPMMAIAGSGSHLYLPYDRNSPQLEKLALVIFDMSCDLNLVKATETIENYC